MKSINEKKVRDGSGSSVGLSSYVSGYIRHTVHGPEKDLPQRAKPYRVMNHDEFTKYNNKVEESGGFDVDGCTGSLSGGIFRAAPTSPWWAQAVLAAQFAVVKQVEDGGPHNLTYKQLLKVNVQAVQGAMFYLTFTAIDNTDGMEKVYRSKIWAPPHDLRVQSLECYDGYEKSAEELRKEIIALFASVEEKGLKIKTPEYYLNGNHPMTPRAVHIPGRKVKKDTMLRAFSIFLNEFRSRNSNMKYAMARRLASRQWRSFGIPEKFPYMREAEDRREEQNLIEESSSHHA